MRTNENSLKLKTHETTHELERPEKISYNSIHTRAYKNTHCSKDINNQSAQFWNYRIVSCSLTSTIGMRNRRLEIIQPVSRDGSGQAYTP
jgi:beta-xylosidase